MEDVKQKLEACRAILDSILNQLVSSADAEDRFSLPQDDNDSTPLGAD